jgi:hypothetical protein
MASTYQQDLKKLTGAQRDAASALIQMFSNYGLESLAGQIINYVKQGFSSDTMSLMLEKTPEYQKRFAANATRLKNGLSVLSPREYIETERSYRALLASSGMPKGFYDTQSDFQKFLENDLSPTELGDRVKMWQTEALKDKEGLAAIRKITGLGASDYAAYLMDPTRATPLLTKAAQAVSFAAAAGRHGYDVSKDLAVKYGNRDVTAENAEQGFTAIAQVQGETDRLARMYGLGGYDVEDAAAEVFGGDANAAKTRQKATSAEKSNFSDSSTGKTGRSQRGNNY